LKDEGATISAASFGWGRRKVQFKLSDGLKVLCHGKLSVYPPRGNYQITVDHIEPLGMGALQLAFEQLKQKLATEGLFDPSLKRSLPRYPQRIAVITSPTGAAIQDILNVLGRRAPWIKVLVVPAVVQGDEAPRHLTKAIQVVNQNRLGDVILLTRGGGSIEDLWCFNDEALARAIRSSVIPLVSAVGHEIDFTISDFVSDLRAPTPSAGAEILTSQWVMLSEQIQQSDFRLRSALKNRLQNLNLVISQWSSRLKDPRDRLKEQSQRIDEIQERLFRALKVRLQRSSQQWIQWSQLLDSYSPLKVLERGYSIVRKSEDDQIVRSSSELSEGDTVSLLFKDGSRKAKITS